ncbi:thiamine-phosphate kinase [Paenibacillus sp. J2TS4]|uniref:thiamine-phosphate kinase n=1 Tax=Paenibacillus sp. J2TS4 TaxID=2807194 RepID=UPI001B09F363|nr:thiamine-phosphate kinase [Paenibacillus sp. J2TS4]GIP35153.1 thiamine-monophosphate kinase [Paenibacillus sp. J2TS4]
MDEFALIRRLTERRASSGKDLPPLVVGIGDDAAVADWPERSQIVMSCDTMVQEIHFKRVTMKDRDVGYKAMASNISDMAAMGAVPRYALVSLSVPKEVPVERLTQIYDGLYECADRFQVTVAGGDTSSISGGIVLTVTIIGAVERGRAIVRSSARAGDAVFVTGYPGGSAAGLDYLLRSQQPADTLGELPRPYQSLVHAHQRPEPQVRAARLLLESGFVGALNDISDGVASEAAEIAEASDVGLLLEAKRLPVHPDVAEYGRLTGQDPLEWILAGGEDYQLLGTVRLEGVDKVKELFREEGIPLTVIGTVSDQFQGVRLLRCDGTSEPLGRRGYNHFDA